MSTRWLRETRMHVMLMIGPGWNPFEPPATDELPLIDIEGVEAVDTAASAANVSRRLVAKVRRRYPRERIEILPPNDETGEVCHVDFCERDLARFQQLTGVPIEQVANPCEEGPGFVMDTVHVMLYETLEEAGWAIGKN